MTTDDSKILIFVETKRKADDITRWLRRDGWPALCIHGDKAQNERDWVLNGQLFSFLFHSTCSKTVYCIFDAYSSKRNSKLLQNFFCYVLEFKTGKTPILIATDVAARGLGEYYAPFIYSQLEKFSFIAYYTLASTSSSDKPYQKECFKQF